MPQMQHPPAMVTSRSPERQEPPPETFCVLPWMHLFADERGVLFPCCRVTGTAMPNVDSRGEPHRIHAGDLEQAWNSEYMKRLRRDMLEGRRPKPCSRCFLYEDLGVKSHRQLQNDKYSDSLEELIASSSPEGEAPMRIRTVDIRLGNLCNLRCRMCFPNSSKKLIDEWAALHGMGEDHEYVREMRSLDWFSTDEFWEVFESCAPDIERLHFAGGEPLLIPQAFKFLERLISLGRAGEITVSYNTNATVLPPEIFDLWPRFKAVRVTASVDGFGGLNSFIRHPSNWERVDHNLKRLDRNAERLNCSVLGFNTTVQVYNVLRLDELLEYTVEAFERFDPPNLSLLSQPECFSVQILPAAMKDQAATRLREFKQRYNGRWPGRWEEADLQAFLHNIDGVIDHMMAADRSSEIPEFVCRNDFHDRYRGQDVREVIPELAPVF